VKIEVVRVHRDGFIFELNDDFYALALGARGKVKQRMLVEAELGEDTIEASAGCFRHKWIVKQRICSRAFAVWICRRTAILYNMIEVPAMTETTYTDLRQRLASVLDRVANDHEVVIVRRKGEKRVALVPADELAALMETAHLLRSPKNARRLLTALQRAVGGKGKPEPLEKLRREMGLAAQR
jgi:antitoxin YefM